jgi:hypothetical protein
MDSLKPRAFFEFVESMVDPVLSCARLNVPAKDARPNLPVLDNFYLREGRMSAEQRRFKRYTVKSDGLDVVSRDLNVVGKLKNINRGGLAYQYAPVNGTKPDSEMIDILGKGPDRFHVSGISCKAVYDISELAADQTFTGAEIRLRGLEFTGLTEEQNEMLDFLLEQYVTEPSKNAR